MRERVGAIIIENDSILVEKRIRGENVYWVFPGGGVDEGESREQALARECKEELGVDVKVGEFFLENFFKPERYPEQKEVYYFCQIIGGEVGTGDGPEHQPDSKYQGIFEVEWLPMSQIKNFDLRPNELRDKL